MRSDSLRAGSVCAGSAVGVQVTGLHHYTISVANMDESVQWYSRALGFELIYERRDHDWGKVGYMRAPGLLLELFEVRDPKPLPAYAAGPEPDTDLMVCGHKHFALLHKSVAEAVEELHALRANVVSFKRVSLEGIGEFNAAFVADNTGGLIEVGEPSGPPCPSRTERVLGVRPLDIIGLHHVAISVPDREEAIRWYSEVLGFTTATTFEVPHIGLKSAMMQGPRFWMEVHCMAGSQPVPEERLDPYTDVQILGNKYFSLGVEDAGRAVEQLDKAGVRIVRNERALGLHRVFISDNSGIPIELFQVVN
jgi:catechol 2,3-dioxygenase-like lactoylglutathione lyase family enzyme